MTMTVPPGLSGASGLGPAALAGWAFRAAFAGAAGEGAAGRGASRISCCASARITDSACAAGNARVTGIFVPIPSAHPQHQHITQGSSDGEIPFLPGDDDHVHAAAGRQVTAQPSRWIGSDGDRTGAGRKPNEFAPLDPTRGGTFPGDGIRLR
jgi:hypothetical protein